MTNHLRRVLTQVKRLGANTQEVIADIIEAKLAEIAEAQWQVSFADPRSQAFFDIPIAQADAAETAGIALGLDDLLKTLVWDRLTLAVFSRKHSKRPKNMRSNERETRINRSHQDI